jgi:hypothetical protein
MSLRRGSATALKASEVVAARGTPYKYMLIWEYVKRFLWLPRGGRKVGC